MKTFKEFNQVNEAAKPSVDIIARAVAVLVDKFKWKESDAWNIVELLDEKKVVKISDDISEAGDILAFRIANRK